MKTKKQLLNEYNEKLLALEKEYLQKQQNLTDTIDNTIMEMIDNMPVTIGENYYEDYKEDLCFDVLFYTEGYIETVEETSFIPGYQNKIIIHVEIIELNITLNEENITPSEKIKKYLLRHIKAPVILI
jgi:hypothetical protein